MILLNTGDIYSNMSVDSAGIIARDTFIIMFKRYLHIPVNLIIILNPKTKILTLLF